MAGHSPAPKNQRSRERLSEQVVTPRPELGTGRARGVRAAREAQGLRK